MMKRDMRFCPILLLLLFVCAYSYAQKSTLNCSKLKNGTFYVYPVGTEKRYMATRKGDIQIERDLDNGDTAKLKIEWKDDCTYTLQYLSGSLKRSPEEEAFFATHKITFQILSVTKDYYVFKGYIEDEPSLPSLLDTIWFKERSIFRNASLQPQRNLNGRVSPLTSFWKGELERSDV